MISGVSLLVLKLERRGMLVGGGARTNWAVVAAPWNGAPGFQSIPKSPHQTRPGRTCVQIYDQPDFPLLLSTISHQGFNRGKCQTFERIQLTMSNQYINYLKILCSPSLYFSIACRKYPIPHLFLQIKNTIRDGVSTALYDKVTTRAEKSDFWKSIEGDLRQGDLNFICLA